VVWSVKLSFSYSRGKARDRSVGASQAIELLGFRTGGRDILLDRQVRQSAVISGRLDILERLWLCGCKLGITGALLSRKVWQDCRLLSRVVRGSKVGC
jgi:hypothetical protein